MKRACFLVVAAVVLGAPAGASAETAAGERQEVAALASRLNDLAGQVKTLQKRVKTLETSVKKLQNDNRLLTRAVGANFVADACLAAIAADAFQGTWSIVDQIATATQSRTYFAPPTAIDDKRSCPSLVPPIARQATGTPTLANLQGLIVWLVG
jgi:hypothetical protein